MNQTEQKLVIIAIIMAVFYFSPMIFAFIKSKFNNEKN